MSAEEQEQWKDPMATPGGEDELIPTKRRVRRVYMGFFSRIQSKLWRALHFHRGTKNNDMGFVESLCIARRYRQEPGIT